MKQKWQCSKCDLLFDDKAECREHEEGCNTEVTFVCNKCGKVEKWDILETSVYNKENKWHNIDLGRMKPGTAFDNAYINFDICDSCLTDFLESFIMKEDAIRW